MEKAGGGRPTRPNRANEKNSKKILPITGLAGVPALENLKAYKEVPDFRLGGAYPVGEETAYRFGAEGGITLESMGEEPLRTAYIAVGTPERDRGGRITNAVIISSYYSGDSTWCYYFWHEGQAGNDFSMGSVVGPGKLIDTEKYYVVFLDALGLWGTSKPSDGLGLGFPHYTVFDMVQANYRLLRDELNVAKVRLATGVSMGAIQSYVWALLHPDYVEAIMPIGGMTCTEKNSVLRWTFKLMSAAMMSDPVWRETNGDYYHLPKEQHPNQGMMFGQSILALNLMDHDHRTRQGWKQVKMEVFDWDSRVDQGQMLREAARTMDVNDLLVRNRSQDGLDIDEYLPSITCPALIMHVTNDLWLRVQLAEESAKQIPGARFASFESPFAHYGVFRAPNVLKDQVKAFFQEIGL
jgi:homoserine O-acetyltransferase